LGGGRITLRLITESVRSGSMKGGGLLHQLS